MKKGVLFTGVIIFLLGVFLIFISGATTGSSPETSKPIIPFLYGTNQTYWMFMAFAGIIIAIIGLFLKGKKK